MVEILEWTLCPMIFFPWIFEISMLKSCVFTMFTVFDFVVIISASFYARILSPRRSIQVDEIFLAILVFIYAFIFCRKLFFS